MERIKLITPPDAAAMTRARKRWNNVAKPIRGLGLLEDAIIKISGITGDENIRLDRREAVIMCADNGVTEENVTQTTSAVTAIVARSIADGVSGINRLANVYGAGVTAADIGMITDVPGTVRKKTRYGTANITRGPAMSVAEAESAIAAGMDIVRDLMISGVKIIIAGEMGIGNTTTASAMASVLLDLPPERVTGRGAGLDDAGLARKIDVIRRAIAVNAPDADRAAELTAKIGGLDIAGMTGLFLGGAVYKIPVIIDGFISAVSAAAAVKINPPVKHYMLASHVSGESAGGKILEYIGLKPVICADMRYGEGTGGVMLLPLLDGALAVYNGAHKFSELPMERYMEL